MSIPLIVCVRDGGTALSPDDLTRLADRLRPDHVEPTPRDVWSHSALGVTAAVLFPGRCVQAQGLTIVLGPDSDEDVPRDAVVPDGAAGILRADADSVEVSTDIVASRTLWYGCTRDVFAASTSQRAVVAALRSYEPDDASLPWLLTAGKLGPRRSWDARVTHLVGDSTVRLDRARWTLKVTHRPGVWQQPTARRFADDIDALDRSLDETFARMHVGNDIVLPISGGYDSRGIIAYLCRHRRPGTRVRGLTWGYPGVEKVPFSDAAVARDLCAALGVEHSFHPLVPEADFGTVFRRFVGNGEGRIDHLGGYTDGFALWASLREGGVAGVLRGDMVFGYPRAMNAVQVRGGTGIPLASDLAGVRDFPSLGTREVIWPDDMLQQPGESATAWNNRLGHEYRLPVSLAALTQLKTPYVEVLNPLLSRRVVDVARTFPLDRYILKKTWRALVKRVGPPVPFARSAATAPAAQILLQPSATRFLQDALEHERPDGRLPAEVLAYARAAVAPPGPPSGVVNALQTLTHRIQGLIRGPLRMIFTPRVNPRQIALRAAIVCATHDLLAADAALLPPTPLTHARV